MLKNAPQHHAILPLTCVMCFYLHKAFSAIYTRKREPRARNEEKCDPGNPGMGASWANVPGKAKREAPEK